MTGAYGYSGKFIAQRLLGQRRKSMLKTLPRKNRKTMPANDAFDEGYDAYWDGRDVSDNPYDEETEERRHWEDGWRAARKHDYDESEG